MRLSRLVLCLGVVVVSLAALVGASSARSKGVTLTIATVNKET